MLDVFQDIAKQFLCNLAHMHWPVNEALSGAILS